MGEELIEDLKEEKVIKDSKEDEEREDEQNEYTAAAQKKRLRERVYIRVMNSIDYEEAAHKLLSMRLDSKEKREMCDMVVDCCLENKTY